MPLTATAQLPVIIGIGELTDHGRDLSQALEPIELMARALRNAAGDACNAGASMLAGLDSLDIVAEHSWPYSNPCALLSARLGITPVRAIYGVTGGESPVRFIHEAALRIARGESTLAAVVGGEATYSVSAAAKSGQLLAWSPRDDSAKLIRGSDLCHPLAAQHGMTQPVQVYPLYENAAPLAWGQTPAQALEESAQLWARYSNIAAANPYAWLRRAYSATEIATPSASNRWIAWPYTKHMVANPLVNQGAAVILTSAAKARELGIAEERWVYVHAGASAREASDYLQRDQYQRCPSQEAVLHAMLEQAGAVTRFARIELYSCFPIVPKMARRTLGLPPDAVMTTTGGLSFFGAPLNNYMTHAAAAMVRGLREQRGQLALLYGQGEFLTKHHAVILASTPPELPLESDYSVQHLADQQRGPVPPLVLDYAGAAHIETFTVVYDRDGAASFGTVIARTPDGARLMARVRGDDAASLAVLTDLNLSAIGRSGAVRRGDAGMLYWAKELTT
jgi:acetyl-CoA acetyltransferase